MKQKKHSQKTNVVDFKRTGFDIGTPLFILILIYIAFISFHFLNKEKISIYEVNEKQMSDDNTVTGIALRDEKVYTVSTTGTVGFYNTKNKKIAKGATIFTLDSTGAYSDLLSSVQASDEITVEDMNNIRSDIQDFRSEFNYSNYHNVYDYKYSIESDVLALSSDSIIVQLQEELNNSGNPASFTVYNSEESGIITYWTDGLETITQDTITESIFDSSQYDKTNIKTSDSLVPGDVACKIINNENWSIAILLDEKLYAKLENKSSIKVRFCKDDLETTAGLEIISSNNANYAILSFNKYLSRYLDDRYIKLELLLNSAQGLKIPVSSLLEKNCYQVPLEYLAKGGNTSKDVLVCEITLENGTKSIKEIDTFAMKDEEYIYIDTSLVQPGTYFYKPDSDDKYQIGEMKTFQGVYSVNNGFCQFKYIEILYENQEYCIVKKDIDYGLSIYDHIVINPELIQENDIIY